MIIQSTTLDTEEKVIAIYGGTAWSKIEGRFLLGASSSYAINSKGGEASVSFTPSGTVKNHTLTVDQLPSHAHTFISQACSPAYGLQAGSAYNAGQALVTSGGQVVTTYVGGNGSHSHGFTGNTINHSNMPPYKSVYIWERTA